MTDVSKLLENKGRQVWSVAPTTSIEDALKLMAAKDVGALLVMEKGRVIGIFSERDYVRRVVSDWDCTMESPVECLMSTPVYYVHPDVTLEECMALMTAKHFRHLPVMDNNNLVGIISIGDVVKELLLEKDVSIKSLEDYIWIHMI
jgi:CBS domain-containing protein